MSGDPAMAPLEEAGQGQSEGFELAEAQLVDRAENPRGRTPDRALLLTGGHAAGEWCNRQHTGFWYRASGFKSWLPNCAGAPRF